MGTVRILKSFHFIFFNLVFLLLISYRDGLNIADGKVNRMKMLVLKTGVVHIYNSTTKKQSVACSTAKKDHNVQFYVR